MTSPEDPTERLSGRPRETIPSRIGPYAIKRRIDSGGMGDVFEGLQENPRRSVAVKVIQAGAVSPEALRRFEYESQILARLRHPGIAQVYEAGTHGEGDDALPYFAMEYIPNARSLTAYADEKKLDTAGRLELFARVCDAVHHGHQKGVVHRDLKPSNILVDSQGNPKVIDFGIARATDSDIALATVQTQVGQLIGSVQYMSPEQFDADPNDIDTRSDVYTLGAILYELLAGRRPYDVSATTIYEAARVVREDAPPRPGSVRSDLRGDVETLVQKAMSKDRDLRYQSAHGLAQDIRRYLSGDAITARPPSVAYQFQVFARRNRALVGAVAAAFVLLIAGGVASTALYLQAEEARKRAEVETARAQATGEFLQETIQEAIPMGYGEEAATMEDLLTLFDERAPATFADMPAAQATVCRTLGWGYLQLTDVEAAHQQLRRAYDLRLETLGETDPATMQSRKDLARIYSIQGRPQDEAEVWREVIDIQTRELGPDDETTLWSDYSLAVALADAARFAEANARATELSATSLRALGADHELTLTTEIFLAGLLLAQGDAEASESRCRDLLDSSRRTFGNEHAMTRSARSQLAASLVSQGKNGEAAELYDHRTAPEDLGVTTRFQGELTPGSKSTQVLVFWETWCPFSQRTVPKLEDVYQQYRDRDLEVIGITQVSRTATEASVHEFIDRENLTFPVVRTDGRLNRYFRQAGTPFVAILKDGVLVWESYVDTPWKLPPTMIPGLLSKTR